MKYLYIHGLNSSGENTCKKLSQVLNEEVINLDWNSEQSYRPNVEYLQEQIEKYNLEEVILLGSSMGGFYARILSNVLRVPCALFNPVMNVSDAYTRLKTIPFYNNITQEIINSYDLAMINDILVPRLIVVGTEDNVIDPQPTISYWKNKAHLVIVHEGHQIQNFEPLKDAILDLAMIAF